MSVKVIANRSDDWQTTSLIQALHLLPVVSTDHDECVFDCSNVKDINSVLEVTVYDEDRDHKVEFLGKLAIPLLRIRNGEKKWYSLKDKKLYGRAKGNSPQILLEMTVLWNPVSGQFIYVYVTFHEGMHFLAPIWVT